MIKLKDLLTEEGGPGSGRPRTGRAPRLDPELVAKGRASRQGQIDYWEKDARKVKRRAAYAAKKAKAKSEGLDEAPRKTRNLGRIRQSILQALKLYTDSPTGGARTNVEARMDEYERAFHNQTDF